MEAREQKAARKKVAARLRDFYAQMRALADVDSEEFLAAFCRESSRARTQPRMR